MNEPAQEFLDEADRQIAAEDKVVRDRRVRVRATQLAEQARRLAASDFPTDPAAMRRRLAELTARRDELAARERRARANPALTLNAAEDDELRVVTQRAFELAKRVRQLDRAQGAAPAAA